MRATPLAAAILAILLCGCSHYSMTSGLVGGIRTVAIPTAENDTPEERIAETLTERISDAFVEDGRLRVVDEETADAVLILRLRSIDDRPFTFTAQEETEQYRFRVFVDAALQKTADQSALLELEGMEGWGTYDATLPEDEGRDVAIVAGLDMIIEEVVDRTTASW